MSENVNDEVNEDENEEISFDIGPILKEWDEDPDSGNIRQIVGSDGEEKIQIRVQFGLLQMESNGRPDGKRPYGKESFLEHFLDLLEEYIAEKGSDEGFELDYHDCEKLHEEALQYYHRYVSFFELGNYENAARDTARNLHVLDLIKEYAENREDSETVEKYRPYITMMNARAKAFIYMDEDDFAEAIGIVNEAIEKITDFYKDNQISDSQIERSQELSILKETAKDIRNQWEGNSVSDEE